MSSRILVIEDDRCITVFLIREQTEEGHRVEHTSAGVAGMPALEQGGWKPVILDWWLPGQDGIDLLRRFRKQDCTTPGLFLTARNAVSQRVEGLDSSAEDYLGKPFAWEELLPRLGALCGSLNRRIDGCSRAWHPRRIR